MREKKMYGNQITFGPTTPEKISRGRHQAQNGNRKHGMKNTEFEV